MKVWRRRAFAMFYSLTVIAVLKTGFLSVAFLRVVAETITKCVYLFITFRKLWIYLQVSKRKYLHLYYTLQIHKYLSYMKCMMSLSASYFICILLRSWMNSEKLNTMENSAFESIAWWHFLMYFLWILHLKCTESLEIMHSFNIPKNCRNLENWK